MPEATVPDIVREAITLFGSDRGLVSRNGGVDTLTATGGTAQSLIDTAGYPSGASETYYRDWWLWNITRSETRKISAQSATAFSFTHADGPWTQPDTGDEYMVLREHPDSWWAAVNVALKQLVVHRTFYEFTPTVADTPEYVFGTAPLAAISGIDASQVFDVEYRGAEDTDTPWGSWADGRRTWRARPDGSDLYLDFGGTISPGTDTTLRLTILEPYTPLSTLSATVDVDLPWVAAATAMAMASKLKRNVPGDDWSAIEFRAASIYAGRREAILGTEAYRTVSTTQRVSGRMGTYGRRGRRGVVRW